MLPTARGEGLSTSQPTTEASVIHILPLGDSITQGGMRGREEYSYRWPLFQMLVDDGVSFDFVGAQTQGLDSEAAWPAEYKGRAFDPHHEGHYGWKTAAVRDGLVQWTRSWQQAPDIALIHLGTNDQGEADYDAAIVQPLREIIGMLRERNPRVVVLIGHLNFTGGAALNIRPLVERMARNASTDQSPVLTVHHYEGWNADPSRPQSDTFDWAHPNPSGQRKMAAKWYESMRPYLKASAAP
jgi:lysophospholipase L1-like esterase